MKIIPAIDIYQNQCVRLYRGDYQAMTSYGSVLQQARDFIAQGTNNLHIIDLYAAKNGDNKVGDFLLEILSWKKIDIQFGGGIRNINQIEQLLSLGVKHVILGSLAVKNMALTKQCLQSFPNQIILALDFRTIQANPYVAIHGWQETYQSVTLWDLVSLYANDGLTQILCTDIDRDGTLSGPNINFYIECIKRFPHLQVQASGGIKALSDITALGNTNVSACIIGKALYENQFTLSAALRLTNPSKS